MKEPSWDVATEEEVWKYVAYHLKLKGIDTILVGGAVVSIYSEGAYKSGDLDMVYEFGINLETIKRYMEEIGFIKESTRHFIHPKCESVYVEFCSPPAAIGNDYKIKPNEVKVGGQKIKIYSPADCIRDRLSSAIHFSAEECVDQAVLVAKNHPVDLNKISKWCDSEGGSSVFERFNKKLK
jgi:hypothetical protein